MNGSLTEWARTNPHMLFVDDSPDGGCVVACSVCGNEFNTKQGTTCPSCGLVLSYPEGASW